MKKKIVVTVGGTGGHVYPAMALAKQLVCHPDIELLFIGGDLSTNRYFQRASFPFLEVSCGSLSLKNPLSSLRNAGTILQGVYQSYHILQEFEPDLVVGFGSYHTFPTLLAAKLCSVPFVLHEANRIPGKVNRLLSKYAAVTGVHFTDTAKVLKGKAIEVTIPLRDGYQLGATTREAAHAYFGLNPEMTTLLIFGGSQGAKAINQLTVSALSLLQGLSIQVLHFTGEEANVGEIQRKYIEYGLSASVKAFESRMDLAWQAADLLISRSGAGTLAEELEFEVPGILVPYPYATDNHQESNADFMVETVQGAVKYAEKALTPEILAQKIVGLLANDNEKLKVMSSSMQSYKAHAKTKDLASIVLDMV